MGNAIPTEPGWRYQRHVPALLLLLVLPFGGSLLAEAPEEMPSTGSAAVVLQINEDIEVGSTIVRLGDVLTPVGPAPDGWERAALAPIGLLPADGRQLRIERQRLTEMLERLKLITQPVRLSGGDTIAIRYVSTVTPPSVHQPRERSAEGEESTEQTAEQATASHEQATASHEQATASQQSTSVRRISFAGDMPRRTDAATGDGVRDVEAALAPAERNRIRRMLESAFERTHPEIVATSEIRIGDSDGILDALEGIRQIRSLRLSGAPGDQDLRLTVSGDTERTRIEATIPIELDDLPLAVVTQQTLNRGELVSAGDVRLEAVPRHRYADDLITRVESIVGMEVKRPLSAGKTIRWDDVTAPIVIRRGELVELRVVGGGVSVTTAARALGTAAEGEPVTVETQSPRRKHLARAVSSGVVEIVTRPPSTAHPAQRPGTR